jgi:hypothetical protein
MNGGHNMLQRFTQLAEAAGPGERSAVRATQAWPYLIARAHNRQTVRYLELAHHGRGVHAGGG